LLTSPGVSEIGFHPKFSTTIIATSNKGFWQMIEVNDSSPSTNQQRYPINCKGRPISSFDIASAGEGVVQFCFVLLRFDLFRFGFRFFLSNFRIAFFSDVSGGSPFLTSSVFAFTDLGGLVHLFSDIGVEQDYAINQFSLDLEYADDVVAPPYVGDEEYDYVSCWIVVCFLCANSCYVFFIVFGVFSIATAMKFRYFSHV
jgi:hypothetical protein